MEQKPEEQNDEFINKEQEEILQKEFNFGSSRNKCQKTKLSSIIDWIIDHVKKKGDYVEVRDCIKKYWFTKQIEEWKKDGDNKDKESHDDELMDIVKKILK